MGVATQLPLGVVTTDSHRRRLAAERPSGQWVDLVAERSTLDRMPAAKRTKKKKRAKATSRAHGPARHQFGRDRESAPGALTDLGCPDCRGVLAVQELGDKGHLSFECRIGHTFSSESLIAAKEEQLDTALWTVVEVFEEATILYHDLAERAREAGRATTARGFAARARSASRHGEAVRELIAVDGPVPKDPPVTKRRKR
jgi:hypothetical protein